MQALLAGYRGSHGRCSPLDIPQGTWACCADQATPKQPCTSPLALGTSGWVTSGAFALPSGQLLSAEFQLLRSRATTGLSRHRFLLPACHGARQTFFNAKMISIPHLSAKDYYKKMFKKFILLNLVCS